MLVSNQLKEMAFFQVLITGTVAAEILLLL